MSTPESGYNNQDKIIEQNQSLDPMLPKERNYLFIVNTLSIVSFMLTIYSIWELLVTDINSFDTLQSLLANCWGYMISIIVFVTLTIVGFIYYKEKYYLRKILNKVHEWIKYIYEIIKEIINVFLTAEDSKQIWLGLKEIQDKYKILSIIIIIKVAHLLGKDNYLKIAGDLTYRTILSIIPILAIIYAMAKGFGKELELWNSIENLVGGSHILSNAIHDSVRNSWDITNAKSGWIFGIAVLILFYSANSAIFKLEQAFNGIWGVNKKFTRTELNRLPGNSFFLLTIPSILMILSFLFDIPEYFISNSIAMEFFPWMIRGMIAIFVFVLLYKYIPETFVMWQCAMKCGIVFGIIFTFWHFLYISFQDLLFNLNKVYGSFSAIPFFLIWCYYSWVICIVGAKACYVLQDTKEHPEDISSAVLTFKERVETIEPERRIANQIIVLSSLLDKFKNDNVHHSSGMNLVELKDETKLSWLEVKDAKNELARMNFIHANNIIKKNIKTYYIARDCSEMSVEEYITFALKFKDLRKKKTDNEIKFSLKDHLGAGIKDITYERIYGSQPSLNNNRES